MAFYGALSYGLYKLTNRNNETTAPPPKVQEALTPPAPTNRHHENSSIIQNGPININDNTRDVYIASRVVAGGLGGGELARLEKYYLGSAKAVLTMGMTVLLDDAPDPTHHWCVVVGNYLHQLQATSLNGGWNYYTNEAYSDLGGWTRYKMGVTNLNDVAIMLSAARVMNDMPEVYDVLQNNCQHFTLRLLDKILRDGRKKVKKLDQTYGMQKQEILVMPMKTKIYKTDGMPPPNEEVEVAPKPIEPVQVKAPPIEQRMDGDGVIDEDDIMAVVKDKESHSKMIEEAVAIMIQTTPSLKEAGEAAN